MCAYVSRSSLRVDELTAAALLLELLAEASYPGIDRAVVDLVIVKMRHAEQLLPRKHPLGRGRNRAQPPGDLHGVLARKLEVENHQVERFARH
jgi:hypothetical protein